MPRSQLDLFSYIGRLEIEAYKSGRQNGDDYIRYMALRTALDNLAEAKLSNEDEKLARQYLTLRIKETRPDNIGCASDEAGDADKMTTREDAKAILAGRMKRAKEMLKGETHAISEEINSKIASLGDEERLRVEVHIDSPEMYPCLKKYLLDRFDSLSDLSVFSRHNGCVYATLNKHEITDIASQVPYVTLIDLP